MTALAHELGHIQAAHHDRATSTNYSYPYGHGFISVTGDLRTIMAYNNSSCPGGSCERVPYFSNPNIIVNGITIGTAQYEDNSRVLNTTANLKASYRSPTINGTLSHDEVWIDSQILSGDVEVPSGVTLTIKSSITINLNGYSIKSTGGIITIESGVTQNYIELKDGSVIKGLYSSLNTAISDAISGQTINMFNNSNLTANLSVPSGITVNIKSGVTLNLNSYKLLLSGGSIVVESGATLNYLAKLKNSYSTLLGYYGTVQTAINDALSNYTVELKSMAYSENLILTNKNGLKLKGAGIGSTTINGNITVTNSTYAQVSDFTIGNNKTITVNGGERPYLYNIGFNNTGYSYVFVYDGYNTDLSGITNFGSSTSPAWNFYNSYTGNIRYSSIEGYDFGVYAASYSEIMTSGMSFCNNMIDLWASSGCWLYMQSGQLSYPGSYYGNVTFG